MKVRRFAPEFSKTNCHPQQKLVRVDMISEPDHFDSQNFNSLLVNVIFNKARDTLET